MNSDIVEAAVPAPLLLSGVALPFGVLSELNLSLASRACLSSLALKASYFFWNASGKSPVSFALTTGGEPEGASYFPT
jgi:hypothetical protein